MSDRPFDTAADAWSTYTDVLNGMGGEARLAAALEFSDSIREIYLDGVRARHPDWSAKLIIRHVIAEEYGIDLPSDR